MKVDDYWNRLCEFIDENRARPMVWGEWDCCQFAAGAVLIMTGVDHRLSLPAYSTEEEAAAILAEAGSLEALLSSLLGEAKPVARAMRGDVLAIDGGAGLAAGICLGVHCAFVGPAGLVFMQTKFAVLSWDSG